MKKKVIVIEDDSSIGDILRIILHRAGFTVILYDSGQKILDDQFEAPDIFLIDRQLSGIDGLEICKFLKANRRTSKTPIIVLSATPGILNVAKSAGADDFIEKPFTKAHLLEKIGEYVQ